MAETTTSASGAQAAPGSQPQVGASQAQAADAQSSQADGADNASGTEDVAALRRELEEARRLAARDRTERRKLEEAIKATEDAKLPEQERLQRRLADLERQASSHEQERRDWQVREAVTRSASKLGYADPVDAFALLDRSALEFADDGTPKNTDRLLADLLRAKPYLAGGTRPMGSFDGGVRGQPAKGRDMNAEIRAATGR
jgi:hypothetical protein